MTIAKTPFSKMGDLMSKVKEQENQQLEKLREEIRAELEPQIEERVKRELEEKYSSQTISAEDREALEKEIRTKVEEEIREELKYEIVEADDNKKENSLTTNILSDSLKAEFNKRFSVFDEIEDEETRNFLKVKSSQMLVIGMDYVLTVGRIGQEVFDELGRKKGNPEGLYTKWVTLIGSSESTMKRYRNRWEVYSNSKDKVKPMIALLSQKHINDILKNEELQEIIYSTEEVTYADLLGLIEGEKPKLIGEQPKEVKFPEEFNLSDFNNYINNNVDKLDEKKKEKFYKLLEQIAKLMKD